MDVNFDLGVGGNDLLTTLADVRNEFVKIRDESVASKKDAEAAFQKMTDGGESAAKALVDYTKKIKDQSSAIDVLTKKLDALEKEKKGAFKSDDVVKYEKEISKLQKELTDLKASFKGVGTESSNTTKKMSAEFQQLAGVLDAARQKLLTLKPDSGAFKQLQSEIEAVEVSLGAFSSEVDESNDSMESAKKKLKEYTVALQNLKIAGLDNTEVYSNLKKEAGELKDTIADVTEEIKQSGSDTAGIDNVVRAVDLATNAYGAYEGVVALTGQSNEAFEKTLIKLNAIMTISNSLQQVMAELKRADNVVTTAQIGLQKIYALVVGTSTGAMKAFRIALAATGVGLIVIALAALAEQMGVFGSESEDAKKATDDLNKSLARQNELLSLDLASLQRRTDEGIAALEATGAKESEIGKARILSLEQQQKLREEDLQHKAEVYNKSFNLDKESFDKAQQALTAAEEALSNINSEVRIARLNNQKTINDELAKQQEEADKKKLEKKEKQAKAEEDLDKRILELQRQLQKARIEELDKERDKEIAAEQQANTETLQKLRENLGIAKGQELRLIQKNIEQEEKNHKIRLLAIDTNYYQLALDALKESQGSVSEALLGEKESEEAAIKERFAGIVKQIEEAKKQVDAALAVNQQIGTTAAGDNSSGLLAEIDKLNGQIVDLTAKLNKELATVDKKYALASLNKAEEIAKAELDILKVTGLDEQALTELKEQGKLQITIDYAKQKLELLKASGKEEDQLQILQLEKTIQDAENLLKSKEKEGKKVSVWTILGLDDMTDQEKQEIMSGISALVQNVTALWTESINARIDQSQRLIDQLQEQIEAQENVVDKEKELMEEGRANNYDVEQKRLSDLQAAKAKEAAELQKAQEQQAKIASAQIAINGIVAASNLAVSAANYFAQGSKYGPVVGTVLALAAIGTMLATFVAAKRQANSAATSQFEHGGEMDLTSKGSSHSRGGVPFYDGPTGKKLGEARQGEYAYFFKNGQKAKEFKPLFDFINSDFSLEPIGLKMPFDETKKTVTDSNKLMNFMIDSLSVPILKEQQGTLKQIADNTSKSTTYHKGYRIESERNRTRKIME